MKINIEKLWTENEEGSIPALYQAEDEYDEAKLHRTANSTFKNRRILT